jgi:uncharacterized protein YjbJ (UPF0337 family)
MMTNTQKLQGTWNQILGKAKEQWGSLTDDDLRVAEGNMDQLIGRIQRRTGETREVIENSVNSWLRSGSSMVSSAAEAIRGSTQGAVEQVREQWHNLSDSAGAGYDQARQMVRARPAQSLAVVFGVGVGLGLLVGLALRSPRG